MYFLLCQETYEAYKAICTNYRLRYNITNPYRLSNLGRPDYCFFPWPDDVFSIGVWLVFCAVVAFWIYKRVNTSAVYGCIGIGFAGLGGSLLLGFQTAFPKAVYVFVFVLSLFILLSGLSGFLTILAVDKLPYFSFPDKLLLHHKTGFPQRYIPFLIGLILLTGLWSCNETVRNICLAELRHDDALFYLCLIGGVSLCGILGYALIPFVTLYDQPLLGGGYRVIIEPLLKINGPAKRYEIIAFALSICAVYGMSAMLTRGIGGFDFAGLVCLGVIGAGIVRSELLRGSKQKYEIAVKKNAGLWN